MTADSRPAYYPGDRGDGIVPRKSVRRRLAMEWANLEKRRRQGSEYETEMERDIRLAQRDSDYVVRHRAKRKLTHGIL